MLKAFYHETALTTSVITGKEKSYADHGKRWSFFVACVTIMEKIIGEVNGLPKKTVDLKKLKQLRKARMSLEEMSRLLGYQSPNGYYYLEIGRTKITAEQLALIAQILHVDIEDLFTVVN
jgi:hypothetical protein